ncbi:MAG: OmpP1/FadL family transporter [Gammaproteobacteria bacterium]|nr:OmpP1/FadL family transporter [Gammaproteobacteria bacterium]
MKLTQTLAAVTTVATLLVSTQINAAGFAIIENSASGMGNSYAGGAASAEDGSTIWFNPAGMTRLDNEMMVAAHVIMPDASYTDDGSITAVSMGGTQLDPTNTERTGEGGQNALVPNFFWVNEINKDLKMGLGINVPFGLGTNYDDDWVGRYHGVKSDVMSLNINPSLAYKMGAVSIGLGINAQYINVDLTSAIDLGTLCVAQEGSTFPAGYCASIGATPQGSDGFADLTASGWGYGYNLGLLYEVSKDIRVGLSYRSGIDHEVDGKADFSVPGQLSFIPENTGNFLDTSLSAAVTVPETTSISYFQNISESIAIMIDYSLTAWSTFDELRIVYDDADTTDSFAAQAPSVTTEEWEDSARISIGLNYQATDEWLYRFGIALDESPIPSAERRTPRIPGNDRTWISFGVTHQAEDARSFSFAYAHLTVDNTAINNTFEASAAAPVLEHTLTGNYQASVDIISAQVSWKY